MNDYRWGSKAPASAQDTAFWDGRESQLQYEINETGGTVRNIRLVTTKGILLKVARLGLDAGVVRMSLHTGGTAGGTWATSLTPTGANTAPVGKNRRVVVASEVTITSGGTHDGTGTILGLARGNGANPSGMAAMIRGPQEALLLPAGTWYIRMATTGTTTGVLTLRWEQVGTD